MRATPERHNHARRSQLVQETASQAIARNVPYVMLTSKLELLSPPARMERYGATPPNAGWIGDSLGKREMRVVDAEPAPTPSGARMSSAE